MKNVLVLGVCAGLSFPLSAQETPVADSVIVESEILPSAQSVVKTPEITLFKSAEVPDAFSDVGRTEIITRREIENAPVQTLSGVLSRAMNTTVQSTGPMASLGQVYMRGGDANTVLILLNGRRVSSQLREIYNLDNIPVTLDMIDHIEIRTGSDAKQFGEFAINGVINIVTRDRVEESGLMVGANGGSLSSYGGNVIGTARAKKWDLVASVAGGSSEWEDQQHSDVKAYLHTQYQLTKWANLFFEGSFVYNKYNMPYLFGRSENAENANTYNFRGVGGFDMPVGKRFNLFATYSYSNFKEQYDPYGYRNTPLDDPYVEYYLDKVVYNRYRNAAFDLGGKYRAKMVDIYFGFNYNSARFTSNDILGDLLDKWQQLPGKPYSFYKYYGVADTWRLYYNMSLKFDKWYANAGLSINNSTEYDNLAFMYGGEFGWKFNDKFRVFVGIDRSFRNETFYEKYVYNSLVHGNDSPENEFVTQWNLGVKYQNDYSNLEITGYLQTKKDAIVLQLQKNVGYFLYSNYSSSNINIQGVEGRYRIDFDKLTDGKVPVTNLSLSYAYNHSDLKDQYSVLTDNYVEHNAQAGLSVRIVKNLSLDVNYALQKRANELVLSRSAADTVSYKWNSLLDARLVWKAKNDRYQIYVQGQNLLNEKYFTTSYLRAPRMSVVGGVKYNLYFSRKKYRP